MTIDFVPLMPRIYICSFPKSGTHLAIRICAHLAQQQKPKHWLGSFIKNSWSVEWHDFEKSLEPIIMGQPAGTWMMGHMGFDQRYVDAFNKMKTCVLFVYRDLRDVAVSQTYHIEDPDDERFRHPGKAEYMALPDHQSRIQAVIKGLGEWPGLIERWELFAPWLDCPDVLPVKYEHMLDNTREVANSVLNYVTTRTGGSTFPVVLQGNFVDAVEKSIALMEDKETASFRGGRSGDWRFEFSDETIKLFNKKAGDWPERMGYVI